MAKKIPGISQEWSEYLTCLLLHMILPLLPLFFEAMIRSDSYPSNSTLAITVALYSMSIGLTSRNKAMFGLCLIIGVSFSVVFGILSGSETKINGINTASTITIVAVFLIHAAERYNRHVADCTPFLEFS